jgi:hypothetical protein
MKYGVGCTFKSDFPKNMLSDIGPWNQGVTDGLCVNVFLPAEAPSGHPTDEALLHHL